MTGGYTGKILFVDLSTGKINEDSPPEQLYRDFIGGTGLGAAILYQHMKPGVDPLGPDNILGFVTGPLTATNVPGGGRFTVVTKSPTTGCWADANSGGFWGPELKWAGYDAVFISGCSSRPVYLLIDNGKAEIKDASHLWGKDTGDTESALQQELGTPKVKVACIGPGGEGLSLMAGIVNDMGRIAARSGVGAVMGSKKLKAVAVRGNRQEKIPVAQPEKLKAAREDFAAKVDASKFHKGLKETGTGGGNSFLVKIGDSPVKNWTTTGLEAMPTCANLDGKNYEKYKVDSYGCYGCPVRCGALIQVKEGPFATKGEVHRPEYETMAALGNMCLNDNIEVLIRANELCNLYGIDTIAVGSVVAYAMECYEKGIITKNDTDGIDLTWGNGPAIIALVEKIGRREGFGNILADGVEKASRKIGKGSEAFAMHIKGHRLPYHDPRNTPALGTIYLVDAQPGCHMESQGAGTLEGGKSLGADPLLQSPKTKIYEEWDKKGQAFVAGAEYFQLLSSAGMCALYTVFLGVPVVELLAPITGWDIDWKEGLNTGRRILTLRQAFNVREGITPDMFKLPKRVTEPQQVGPAKGVEPDFEAMKKSYFESMDWDLKTGKPSSKTMTQLGLEKMTADII